MESDLSDDVVAAAFAIAADIHRGQVRADGVTPYIMHLWCTAFVVRMAGGSPRARVKALLHHAVVDYPEFDIDAALARIPMSDDDRADVREAVMTLTHPPGESNIAYFHRILAAPPETIMVKLADRLDNIIDMENRFSDERIRRYCAETMIFLATLRSRCRDIGFDDLFAAIERETIRAIDRANASRPSGVAA